MLFSTAKITLFLAGVVVVVSAQSGVFFSAPGCAGTTLQTVEYTNGLCVPSNGAVSVLLANGDQSGNSILANFFTSVAQSQQEDLSFTIDLGSGGSECVDIPGNIQSVGMDF
ncbi:hypothetical protein C8J57DRAFT_1669674 [Mycena rebaudengoi]|nr:hypothetical protein C8J57DRAFT_1669674 [Mycena rebaudengoi]